MPSDRIIVNGKAANNEERRRYIPTSKLGRKRVHASLVEVVEDKGYFKATGPWIDADNGQHLSFIDWPLEIVRAFPLSILDFEWDERPL
jgi:hypothetical protein